MHPHKIMRQLRIDNHFSQKEVYTRLNWKQQTYSNKELNKRKLKSHDKIELAEFYNVSVSVFDENPPPLPPSSQKPEEKIEKFMVVMQNGMIMSVIRVTEEEEEMKKKKGGGNK